jgi:hypothetical protein
LYEGDHPELDFKPDSYSLDFIKKYLINFSGKPHLDY